MFQQGVATENGRGLTVQLPLLLLTKPWILVGHTTATAAKNTVNYYQSLNEWGILPGAMSLWAVQNEISRGQTC